MPDLIPPHGGLTEPVDRTISENDLQSELRRIGNSAPRIVVKAADFDEGGHASIRSTNLIN